MRRASAAIAFFLAARPAAAAPVEGFPCPGCFLQVPSRTAEGPRPLLVALHGDGAGVRKVLRAWKGAADAAGVLLLVPRCPRELGCTSGSWWQWLATSSHDAAWLGAQIDAVAARHAVDPARVYAAGYSGGATYLGWYVPAFPARFAAVAHVAGGARLGGSCPSCKTPVRFDIGAVDPMIGPYTEPLRRYYEACGGHEVVWQTLPGVTHEGILGVLEAGRAKEILAWLLARPAGCVADDAGAVDGGDASDAGDAGDAGDASGGVVDAGPLEAAPEVLRPIEGPRAGDVRAEVGCACGRRGASSRMAAGAAMLAAVVARRRRRAASKRSGGA